ncbi:MAG: hypothetical protein IJV31_07490 [Clostridia bacterium]|nr:hypothetical protein [Clostridia bacterium]
MKRVIIFVAGLFLSIVSYAVRDMIDVDTSVFYLTFENLGIDTNKINNTALTEIYPTDSSIYKLLDDIILDNPNKEDSSIFYDMQISLFSDTNGVLYIQKDTNVVYYLDLFYGYIYYKNDYFFVSSPRYVAYYEKYFKKSENKKYFYPDWNKFELVDDSPEKLYHYV